MRRRAKPCFRSGRVLATMRLHHRYPSTSMPSVANSLLAATAASAGLRWAQSGDKPPPACLRWLAASRSTTIKVWNP